MKMAAQLLETGGEEDVCGLLLILEDKLNEKFEGW